MDNKKLYPDGVMLDITTKCFHNCAYCFPQKEKLLKPEDMEKDVFDVILSIIKKERFRRVYLYLIGEPMLHPYFYYFLKECGRLDMKTYVATKGAVPIDWKKIEESQEAFIGKKKGMEWLIEVPAWNQESANHICSIDLEKQKENLKRFGEMVKSGKHKNIKWKIRTIVTRWNERELNKIKSGLNEFGLTNWNFKRPGYFIEPPKEDEGWMPSNKYSRRFSVERKRCPYPKNIVINYRGDVSVCCHDMLFQNIIGNIMKERTIKGILIKNKKTMQKRLSMKLNICKQCN